MSQPNLARFCHARMSPTAQRRAVGIRPVMADLERPAKPKPAPNLVVRSRPSTPYTVWPGTVATSRVLDAVAEAAGIKTKTLRGKNRQRRYAWPRHIACYLLRKRLEAPFAAIASTLNRDHTAAHYACRQAEYLIETTAWMRAIHDRAVAILDGSGA